MNNIGNISPEQQKKAKPEVDQAIVDFPRVATESMEANIEKNETVFRDLHNAILGLEEDILVQRSLLAKNPSLKPEDIQLIKDEMKKREQLLASVIKRAKELLSEIITESQSWIDLSLAIDKARSQIFSGREDRDLPPS